MSRSAGYPPTSREAQKGCATLSIRRRRVSKPQTGCLAAARDLPKKENSTHMKMLRANWTGMHTHRLHYKACTTGMLDTRSTTQKPFSEGT